MIHDDLAYHWSRRGARLRIKFNRLAVIGKSGSVLYRLRWRGMWTPLMVEVPHRLYSYDQPSKEVTT